jgi:uncharacterized Zn finger protein
MEHDIVDLYCPKCDERTTCVVGNVDMDKPLACGNCGRVTRWGSLRTASGIRLEDHIADVARNALGQAHGLKPGL